MSVHEIVGVAGKPIERIPFLELSGSQFSLTARYKVLAGGQHLNPAVEIDPALVKELPHIPTEGYQLIHTQWQERREMVTASVAEWGERAAKATAILFANQSHEDTKQGLAQLFGGIGIAVDLSRPLGQQLESLAASFSGGFYQEFCQGEDAIQKLAGALVGAFAKEQDPDEEKNNPFGGVTVIGDVRDFRASFTAAEPFFKKLLGDEALYQQFSLCIDAQASHLSGELLEVVREQQEPLSPQEDEILSTLFKLSSRYQEYKMAAVTDPALPAQRRDNPTIPLLDRSSPVWASQDPAESGESFGPPPRADETSESNDGESSENFMEAFQHVVDIYPDLRLGLLVSLLRTKSEGDIEMPQVVRLAKVLHTTPEVLQTFIQQHSKSVLEENDIDAINTLFSESPLFTQLNMPDAVSMIESQSFETLTQQVRATLQKLGIPLHLAEDMDITSVFPYEACADVVATILQKYQAVKNGDNITIPHSAELLADIMARMPTVYDQLSFIRTYAELEQLSTLFEKTNQKRPRPARRRRPSPSDSHHHPPSDANTSGGREQPSPKQQGSPQPPAWIM